MPILRPNARLGPYTIVEMLRMGGMACLYLAQWAPAEAADAAVAREEAGGPEGAATPGPGESSAATGKPPKASTNSSVRPIYVAVKVANTAADVPHHRTQPAEELEAFYYEALNNEVEVLKHLHHPGIVRLYPVPWGIKKDPYIVRATNVAGAPWFCAMEYLAGGSVAQLMESQGRLSPSLAVEIAYQVALALEYMHGKGFAHLDVKPDNILLRQPPDSVESAAPQAVLIDFGISRRREQAGPEAGSLPYIPPEMVALMTGAVAPELLVDGPPVDVYGVGVLLYQMLTGHLPFSARDDVGVTTAILHGELLRPTTYVPDIAGPLEELILHTLERDPNSRPRVDDLVQMIDLSMSPRHFVGALPVPHTVPAARPGERAKTRLFAGTTILLAGLSLAQLVLWGPLRPPGILTNSPPTTAPVSSSTPSPLPASPTPMASDAGANVKTATAQGGTAAVLVNPPATIAASETPLPTATALPPSETPLAVYATSTAVSTRTATPTSRPSPTARPTANPTSTATP